MKTLTKTVFALLLTATVFTSSAFTSQVSANTIVLPSATKSFNRIWVAGNVKIVLTQNENESITVGDDFDADKTSIQSSGQTLYINSTEGNQVTINIAVKDLQRIQAAGAAVVEMKNHFDVKYLQLFLSQSASVKVNANVESLYTVIKENATLKIKGAAADHTLMASNIKNVKFGEFAGSRTNTTIEKATQLAVLSK